METRTLDGIVVGRQDQGEEDRIVRVLTAEEGLVSVWASRARRARSPFAVLDLAVRVRLTVRGAPGKGAGDLHNAVSVEVVEARVGLRTRLERLGPAAVACETAGALATTVPDPRLFGCLETALILLDQHDDDPAPGFLAALLTKLLTFGGVAPALDRCPHCGLPPSTPMAWSEVGGGAFHVHCLPPDAAGAARVDLADLAQLARLRRLPMLDAWAEPAIVGPMLSLVEAHLGHALRARAWLG